MIRYKFLINKIMMVGMEIVVNKLIEAKIPPLE